MILGNISYTGFCIVTTATGRWIYIYFYVATTTVTVVIISSSENGHPMSSNVIQPTIIDGPQTMEANTMTSKLAEQTKPTDYFNRMSGCSIRVY